MLNVESFVKINSDFEQFKYCTFKKKHRFLKSFSLLIFPTFAEAIAKFRYAARKSASLFLTDLLLPVWRYNCTIYVHYAETI